MAALHAGLEFSSGQCVGRLSPAHQRGGFPQRAFRHQYRRVLMILRFSKSTSGAAAVEFAMLLPVMITLFFGVVETTLALVCRADISQMAATAADLISQVNTANTADLTNVYAAAGTVLYPYYSGGATGKPTIRITSVVYDSTSATPTTSGKVAWTCTQAGTGTLTPASRSVNDTVTFAQPLMTTNGSVLMAE